MPKIQIIDRNSQSLLFECEADQSHLADQWLESVAELDLDLEMKTPTITASLHESLTGCTGMPAELKAELEAEIKQHDNSCCFTPLAPPSQHTLS
jgi:hypothetical protein